MLDYESTKDVRSRSVYIHLWQTPDPVVKETTTMGSHSGQLEPVVMPFINSTQKVADNVIE